MNQAQLPYVLLYLCSTFLASISQVLLKKAAMREHRSLLAEYTDWRVILGYGLCYLYRFLPQTSGHVAFGMIFIPFIKFLQKMQ